MKRGKWGVVVNRDGAAEPVPPEFLTLDNLKVWRDQAISDAAQLREDARELDRFVTHLCACIRRGEWLDYDATEARGGSDMDTPREESHAARPGTSNGTGA